MDNKGQEGMAIIFFAAILSVIVFGLLSQTENEFSFFATGLMIIIVFILFGFIWIRSIPTFKSQKGQINLTELKKIITFLFALVSIVLIIAMMGFVRGLLSELLRVANDTNFILAVVFFIIVAFVIGLIIVILSKVNN